MKFSTLSVLLLTAVSTLAAPLVERATGRTTAPSGTLVVSKSAKSGQYSTIQAAINKLSTSSTAAQSIFIESGVYDEQVYIPARKAALTIYGYTTDTSSYVHNTVNITHGIGADTAGTDDLSGTVRNWAENTKVYNINIINTRGQGSQAIAISASAGNQGYYGCQFWGFQDTVMAQTGAQLYAKSLIVGATDFIFGQHATAWFSQVDLRVLKASKGYVTANGRPSSTDPSFYVFDRCTIAAAAGNSVPTGAYYLGRPWGEYARVMFQGTGMTNVINSAGWSVWGSSDPRTAHATFEEYNNSGAGSTGTRASFSKKTTASVGTSTVLGQGYAKFGWVDTSYLPA